MPRFQKIDRKCYLSVSKDVTEREGAYLVPTQAEGPVDQWSPLEGDMAVAGQCVWCGDMKPTITYSDTLDLFLINY